MKKLPFHFNVVAQADNAEPATITVRGEIGDYLDDYWTITNTEEAVLNELNKIPAGKKINLHVNSPGGNVNYTLGIYNALQPRRKEITTVNTGFAGSSGSLLMLAGDHRICPDSSWVMIHRPSGGAMGNEDEMQNYLNGLQTCQRMMADIYAKHLGITPEKAQEMMKNETYMTGKEAVACGFATSSGDDSLLDADDDADVQARARIMAHCKNLPEILRTRLTVKASAANPPPTPQPQPKVKSMKKITAALVAAGLITASTEEQTEDSLLPQINAVLAENKRLKTENETFVTARKARVTTALDAAVTDKVIAETRKPGLLALGTASAEGETEVLAQLGELREAKAQKTPRGAAPVPRAQGGGEADTIEALLEEQAEAMKGTDGELLANINARLAVKRGRDKLFTPHEEHRAYRN